MNRHSEHRLQRRAAPSVSWAQEPDEAGHGGARPQAAVDCGWGRLIFAHTYAEPEALRQALAEESPGRRDLAIYVHDPHVLLALAPQELFLDPSHTYRLWLARLQAAPARRQCFTIRTLQSPEDGAAINRLYRQRGMVECPADFFWAQRKNRQLIHLVAEDAAGAIIGSVTGVDHVEAFGDPERGASLWCLAVDPQAQAPGIGKALVRHLAGLLLARGRAYLDLSVLHDNHQAIALYRKLGFRRVPVFCVKRKNPINRQLFVGPGAQAELNPYARIIVDEAARRGIRVEVEDAAAGLYALEHGGRRIRCRESLSDLTSAVVLSRCADKGACQRRLARAGLRVPAQQLAASPQANAAFLAAHGRLVVKPLQGEQGQGVRVDLREAEDVEAAIRAARRYGEAVLLEEFVPGEDLRIVVIGEAVVAAALRRPAAIVGDGRLDISTLIAKQSRRREAATHGESRIPDDEETWRCVADAGYGPEDVLPQGERLVVRRTANLHTGGTLHDVTEALHPALARAALDAARAVEIPVCGVDMLVPAADQPDYALIEINERPGLANHEPQPTAERYIDLLFPETRTPN